MQRKTQASFECHNCRKLRQILAKFLNSFSGSLNSKFSVNNKYHQIPWTSKHFATVSYENLTPVYEYKDKDKARW